MPTPLNLARITLALATLSGVGCTYARPEIYVTPAGPPRARGVSKASDCSLEYFRTRPPDRPYEEIAAVHYLAVNGAAPPEAQASIQAQACGLGADAVIITRERYSRFDQGGTEVTSTAIKYRGAQ